MRIMDAPKPVTDYDLQALVDNELDHEEEKRIRAYIEQDFSARKRYDELVKQKKAVMQWWQDSHKAH